MKLTNSQNLIIQGVLSILVAALLTALTAGIQFIGTHNFDLATLISVMIASFGGYFGLALKNFVPQHAKDELQAYKDLTSQLQQALHIQATTPPTVVIQQAPITTSPGSGSSLQGVSQSSQFIAPQQSFPVGPQPQQTATAGTSPVLFQSLAPNPTVLNPTPTPQQAPQSATASSYVPPVDSMTQPRVAALLSQYGQQS